jgi:predicted secreted protein
MNWVTGLMVYAIVWWVVIFAVLPWGVRVPDEPEPGHASSAPDKPMLWRKAAITTVVSAVIWFAIYLVIESDLISFRPT